MQKFLFLLSFVLLTISALPGCRKDNDPKGVALKFLSAIQQMHYEEAKQYATESSKSMLDALASFQKMMPASAREKYQHEQFEIKHVEQNGQEATVYYTNKSDTTVQRTLKLLREKGKWKVAFTKDTLMPDLTSPSMPDSIGESALPVPPGDSAVRDSSAPAPDSPGE
ncbi:hypothetical protein [Compostibacter hankyongensis]|uniref:DUF4878 domain-containing protein n=1 Tax=Compostibacter hankyongensis TaxID=1007089 RepID=A0ABP8FQG8_9BACT